MQQKIAPYESRLYRHGLVDQDGALFAAAGKPVECNRKDPACTELEPLFSRIPVKTILYARPAEPYRSAIDYLAETAPSGVIQPDDSETRMFLKDLPVAAGLDTEELAGIFKNRKCAVIPGRGLAACGPDFAGAYVNFSAACFAGFVKFFSDTLKISRADGIDKQREEAFSRARGHLSQPAVFEGGLMKGPFGKPEEVQSAITEAGRRLIETGLVNACFGNISYRLDDTLYISCSGSFMDELEDAVVSASLKDYSCTGGKPSSEFPVHIEIAESTDFRAVVHGHPLFSVIMSMDCREKDCQHEGYCYRDCPRQRQVSGIPVVPGETGEGPFGLSKTVPPAVRQDKAAIVYGHGVFTCASEDFNSALGRMMTIESLCRKIYFDQIKKGTDVFLRPQK
ncbi:MAG: class II aldolase/adducin family protein [Desulfobacteraceae bacterium]|nr:class II aldolase/adducin family protein [Desulfobacteraceae bacterium]